MSQILLRTTGQVEASEIVGLFKTSSLSYQCCYDNNAALAFIKYEPPKVLVVHSPGVDEKILKFVDDIRKSGFKYSIVILSRANADKEIRVGERKHIHFYDDRKIQSGFVELLKKLVIKPFASYQRHKRYPTFQPLSVECMEDGRGVDSYMTNLSVGGAYCIFDENPKLKKGSLIRLSVKLDEVNKSHNMHAQVVWAGLDEKTGKSGCGVRFIQEQEMYSQLLQRL